jgi:hypothetical protein
MSPSPDWLTKNRAQRRAAMSQQRRYMRSLTHTHDARECVNDDLTTVTLHPTKGFRRLCGRRVQAQADLPKWQFMWGRWATNNIAAAA